MPGSNFKYRLIVSLATMVSSMSVIGAHAQSNSEDVGFAGVDICTPGIVDIPFQLKGDFLGEAGEQPTNIEADEITKESDDVIKLIGNAQVVQGDRGVFADEIDYDQKSYKAIARGNVKFYTSTGDEILADSLEMEIDTFIGSAQNAKIKIADGSPYYTEREHQNFTEDYSILAPFRNKVTVLEEYEIIDDGNTYVRARAEALSIEFEGSEYEVLHDAQLTTCEEGNEDVLLVAKEIEMDHVSGVGTAKSLKIKFKKIPIFYFPTVSFPINDERKTGFLFPGIGYEKESGYMIEVPYYINIAPQKDLTIIPRILSHRGLQVFSEYRYLTKNSRGNIKVEILPSDSIFNDDRYAFSFGHSQDFNENWYSDVDLQSVSDTSYLRDFSSDVDVTSSSFLPQRADLNYRDEKIKFRGRVSSYEAVNDSVSVNNRPYDILPELNFDLRKQTFGSFDYGFESEYTNYQHELNTRVSGGRLLAKPYVELPLEKIYGYLTPRFSVQSISYSLDNNPTGDSSPSVAVPITSIDSGLFFERLIKRPNQIYLQTLEPRLFYVNIPDKLEQEAFPDFDTGGGSNSSFSHFFRENRFFGGDRVGDTHQISVGLTSRILNDDTGEQVFKLSIGQIFYLDDRQVGLAPDSAPETENKSDFLAEATASITEDWDVRAFTRLDSETNDTEFFQLSLDYDHSNRRNGSVRYSKTKGSSEQINIDLEFPLGPRWQFEASTGYSLRESKQRNSEFGISYDGCCWAAKLLTQRYLDGTGVFKNRYIVTFELDDLGRLTNRL